VTSFDQLQLEDDLEQFWVLLEECRSIDSFAANADDLIARIYLREIREVHREPLFEEYLKTNAGSQGDLKTVNLIHQVLDERDMQQIQKQTAVKKEGLSLFKEEVNFKVSNALAQQQRLRAQAPPTDSTPKQTQDSTSFHLRLAKQTEVFEQLTQEQLGVKRQGERAREERGVRGEVRHLKDK